ncbi:MAG: hypothetical protein KDA61_18910, partial [Planctomycetales bacterium]|nr:hypothetical protein [Planctomycetales bacterium]
MNWKAKIWSAIRMGVGDNSFPDDLPKHGGTLSKVATASASRLVDGGRLEGRLARYLALAGGIAAAVDQHEAFGVVVSNSTLQPFGINEEVNIDFNG